MAGVWQGARAAEDTSDLAADHSEPFDDGGTFFDDSYWV